ncbi:MAG: c-type cytochrome biogenesis protein CcmI [Betaproteobacteria bacterium]|nr:c-type cytochrome biogenesis protein CcmI [Betaproteobacteria bacterium]
MLIFSLFAAGLVALALLFLLPPLLRSSSRGSVSEDAAVVSVYRDQLAELERDLAQGTLSPDQHAQAKLEIEQRLAEDLRARADHRQAGARSGRWIAWVLGLLIPVAATGAYVLLGTPKALDPVVRLGMSPDDAAQRHKMLELTAKLAERMEDQPGDPRGWLMLARSYRALGKLPESERAYRRLIQVAPDDADAYADLAETLAVEAQGRIEGEALAMARKALDLDAHSEKALALLGTAAYDEKDYGTAIDYWQRLLKLAPAGTEYAKAVQAGIDQARQEAGAAGKPGAKAQATAQVSGEVTMDPSLRDKVKSDDTVFIYARAETGPRMPLAVLRRQVRDLPVRFKLDDSMSMVAGMSLSKFDHLIVGARVSRSGNPMPASGDLEGQVGPVAPGAAGLNIRIDREVP